MSTNRRKEFEDAVWNRIEELIKEKKIKQSQLVRKCEEIGMPITQPELSKLYNETKKINIYELTAISKALNVPVDFFVSADMPYQDDLLSNRESTKLLSKAEDEAFFAYFGEYYIYFNETVEQVEKVLNGRMVIYRAKDGYCKVELRIHTGIYRNKKEIIKKYEGRLLIASLLAGAYIVVRNDSIGELCFMIMRHKTFTTGQMECRMALCLTVGAGENKFPTAHRMLISREELSDKHVKDIQPYFDLYGDVIRIEKSKANELRNVLDGVVERNALDELWRRSPEKEYYEVSIELLRRHLQLGRKEFAFFIANLLRLADTEPHSKIRDTDDRHTFEMIDYFNISKKGIPPDAL